MLVELVTVTTTDQVELDGAMHELPTQQHRPNASILMIHGLTWNFYRGPSRWLPPLLAEAGLPCLSLNMRDHTQAEPKDFELAHHDIRAGVDYLSRRFAGEVALLAHGFGCNKAACYAGDSGDDRIGRTILTTLGAVKAYRPEIWDRVLSRAPAMRGKALVVQGAIDHLIEARARADELSRSAANCRADVVLLEGADHYFNERHKELADCVIGWMAAGQKKA
jgi:alpha/beta superfamily hydrolase